MSATAGDKQRRRRGRRSDPATVAAVETLLGDVPRRRDLLIEYLHRIQDDCGYISRAHCVALAELLGLASTEVYEVATFYHHFDVVEDAAAAPAPLTVRVCDSMSCEMFGANALIDELERTSGDGVRVQRVPCVGRCAGAPVAVVGQRTLDHATSGGVAELVRERQVRAQLPAALSYEDYRAAGGYDLLRRCHRHELSADSVIETLSDSGLRGLGGAGFPAGRKWSIVRGQAAPRMLAVNIDEGEPGTFKDREVLVRRPDLVLEGLAIAARAVGAEEVYLYLRGEFGAPWRAVESAIERFEANGLFEGVSFHLHAGHGAYICGEETALLEALEGKRGMPRLKPPFPTENGLWGKPTLIHNVETIACVPAIVERGGDWFRALGRAEAGTKLYSISGDVGAPGNYELPLGVSLDELVAAAGGYVGELLAFSPGGASSGFLPASERTRPLDFKSLAEAGSMLGSAGVVVLNTEANLVQAVADQLRFFEDESCGQCAPCRIGTRFLREALTGHRRGADERDHLQQVAEVAWEMNEGSICGLGQAAALPLTTALKHFPDAFDSEQKS